MGWTSSAGEPPNIGHCTDRALSACHVPQLESANAEDDRLHRGTFQITHVERDFAPIANSTFTLYSQLWLKHWMHQLIQDEHRSYHKCIVNQIIHYTTIVTAINWTLGSPGPQIRSSLVWNVTQHTINQVGRHDVLFCLLKVLCWSWCSLSKIKPWRLSVYGFQWQQIIQTHWTIPG